MLSKRLLTSWQHLRNEEDAQSADLNIWRHLELVAETPSQGSSSQYDLKSISIVLTPWKWSRRAGKGLHTFYWDRLLWEEGNARPILCLPVIPIIISQSNSRPQSQRLHPSRPSAQLKRGQMSSEKNLPHSSVTGNANYIDTRTSFWLTDKHNISSLFLLRLCSWFPSLGKLNPIRYISNSERNHLSHYILNHWWLPIFLLNMKNGERPT